MYLDSSYIISYFLCASLKEPYLGGKNMLLGLYSVREGFAHIYCSTNVFPWRAKSLMFSFCFLQFAAKICLLTSFRDTCFVEIVPQYQTPQRGKVLLDYYLIVTTSLSDTIACWHRGPHYVSLIMCCFTIIIS